jgi:hypothetical protein
MDGAAAWQLMAQVALHKVAKAKDNFKVDGIHNSFARAATTVQQRLR